MTIVINDADRRLACDRHPFTDLREAALDPAKRLHRAANLLVGGAELQRHGDGRQRILDIVLARHGQGQPGDHPRLGRTGPAQRDIEMRAGQIGFQVDRADIGLAVEAIGDAAPVRHPRGQALHFRVVGAQHGKAVEGQILDKSVERLAEFLHRPVMVHMFRIDIGHHRAGRVQLGKGAVAFIAFDHHPVALARLVVGAIGMDDPAIDDRRVDIRAIQQRRDHAGRRRLAMRARDADRIFQARDLGQHVGPADDRNASGPRGIDFRIAGLDRRRDDDRASPFNILGGVADEDFRAPLAQALDIVGLANVGALHLIAHRDHDIRDAGHANAANAHNMGRAEVERGG